MPKKIVFFGTPDFAVPALDILNKKHEIVAVVTQPDRPSGRGLELKASPVKQYALANSITCLQPENLKNADLKFEKVDAAICVAYGNIIPAKYLDLTPSGIINIHPSLLPRWRGAAPLQWSLFSGDIETGVCLMKLDKGLDTGDVFICERYKIQPNETLGSLHDRLAKIGAELLANSLDDIISGKLNATAQSEQGITYAEKWEKQDASINWEENAIITDRRIRASNPIPGAHCMFEDKIVKIFSAKISTGMGYKNSAPGEIVATNKSEIIISCGEDSHLSICEMQIQGKKRLSVSEILKGNAFKIGDKFCPQ